MATWKNKWEIPNADQFNQIGISADILRDFKSKNIYERVDTVEVNGVINKNITVKAHSFISNVCTFTPEVKGLNRTGNNVIFYEGYKEESVTVEWKYKEKTEYVEITDKIEYSNTKYVDEKDEIIEGTRGKIITSWEEEYKNGISTGNTRNKQEKIIIKMIPRRIIKGTKQREKEPVVEWRKKTKEEKIEIVSNVEYDNTKYEDTQEEIIQGKEGLKRISWEEEYKDGVSTGQKRNETVEIVNEMIPTRIIKGSKKRDTTIPDVISNNNLEVLNEIIKRDYIQTDIRITIDNKKYDSGIFKQYPKIEKVTSLLFGDFIMTKCEFELFDREEKLDVLNKEVMIEKAVIIDEKKLWYKLGYFTIVEITSDKSAKSIKCKAYDRTNKFNNKYESNLEYPAKGIEIIKEIAEKRNVKINGTFAFADFLFEKPNFKDNTSEREAIAKIAELGGEHAYIDSEGTLKITKAIDTKIVIDGAKRTEYSLEKEEKPIGSISLGFEGYDDDYIAGKDIANTQRYRIENNPYADLVREKVAQKALINIKGIKGRAFMIKGAIGAELLNINDQIVLRDNNNIDHILTILSIKTDGTIKGDIGAGKIENKKADYKIAGSVKEDLKNVSLKVNHIDNVITSEVNKTTMIQKDMNTLKGELGSAKEQIEDYTKFKQDVNNFKYEIKTSGSTNILYDSVFFSFSNRGVIKDSLNQIKNENNNELRYTGIGGWTGNVITNMGNPYIEPISITADFSIARHGMRMQNYKLIQYVTLKTNDNGLNKAYYSFSFKYRKNEIGDIEVNIVSKDNQYRVIKKERFSENTSGNFKEIKMEKLEAKDNEVAIEISAKNNAIVEITDLMLNIGETCIPWTQAIGETRSTDVNIGLEGISVKSKNGNETVMRPDEFAGYDKDGNKIFKLNNDITEVEKLKARSEITMPPLRIVPITEGERQGWAFVTTTPEDKNILN